jgi:hypothetical protein
MAAVEMTGTGGEALQIVSGKKATLTMPIPASIMATAPATIPLWHFDEVKGLWIEEGSAVKTGNAYVGEVSHFSFWNVDVPSNFVQFDATIIDANGQPLSNVLVLISVVSQPYNGRAGYTNGSGYVGGAVPANSNLLFEIYGDWVCSSMPVYSQTFTTVNSNISLGNVTIPSSLIATASGNVIDCNGNAVNNGSIIMNRSGIFYSYPLTSTGLFSFITSVCGSNNVSFIAEDDAGAQQSSEIPYTLVSGVNAIGTLSACGVAVDQFVNYTINGTPYSFTHPGDSLYMSGQGTTTGSMYIGGHIQNQFTMEIDRTAIGAGSVQSLLSFNSSETGMVTGSTGVSVNITEWGTVDQYVSGNFSGTLNNGTTTYAITCNFRVRRTF